MYAELVCGPPGSGKTTYCEARRQFLSLYDETPRRRRVVVVNMDPANDGIFPFPCDIDITELVSLREVMTQEGLGPNGAYLFSIDVIAEHTDWLTQKIAEYQHPATTQNVGDDEEAPLWLVVDCPGQVEFYLQSDGMQKLTRALQKPPLRCSVCVVHLCDAVVVTRDVSSYVSTCLLALSTMTDLELPHLNVLNKWDMVVANHEGQLPEDETKATPEELEPYLETPMFLSEHFKRLWHEQAGRALGTCGLNASRLEQRRQLAESTLEVVEGYNLVSFVPLSVHDGALMSAVDEQLGAAVGFAVQ